MVCGLAAVLALILDTGEGGQGPGSGPHLDQLAPSLAPPPETSRAVERWMERFLGNLRPEFERYLAREGLYSPMIREELRRRGMPEELLYLAAIESGFSPVATAQGTLASGLWQLMSPTALALGLRIDEWVDERRDPVGATGAALDYLQALYARFGSWYLAAAAFNAGPGRVSRALEAHRGESWGDEAAYWEILGLLPPETREYVPKMLAAALLAQATGTYGFRVERAPALAYDRVWVPGGTSLRRIAESVGLPLGRIRELNPHLLQGVTPPEGPYAVRVPPGRSPLLLASMGGRWRRMHRDGVGTP
jgi:membrane-bound lytic murein transglycosylase D